VKDLLDGWELYAEVDNADSFYREVCSEKLLRRVFCFGSIMSEGG
jgi:hypothetical protein